jgi:alpha-beta hydrolase superfamily lysophospholipase
MGDADPVADPAAAAEFVRGVGSADRTFIHYPEHLHELLREKGREVVFQTIYEWIQRRGVRTTPTLLAPFL